MPVDVDDDVLVVLPVLLVEPAGELVTGVVEVTDPGESVLPLVTGVVVTGVEYVVVDGRVDGAMQSGYVPVQSTGQAGVETGGAFVLFAGDVAGFHCAMHP